MAKILVIEDEADLRQVLAYNLQAAGHQPLLAATGREGLGMARGQHPDLILLDLMLPDLSGNEICRLLKGEAATREIGIIMLTARGEEVDRLVGFELGADDYVTKPFSVRELLLRVRAVLRRGRTAEAAGQAEIFGCLRVDPAAHRVWVNEDEVTLTLLEFRLLARLFQRRDRVQSRETLLDKVWGIDAEVTTRTVDTHVKRLREKLGPAGRYIETVRGVGYRFTGRPESAEP
jgi:two-component system, OmpR family, phosphate regulon response regulator PhoB